MKLAPIHLEFMLKCACSSDPKEAIWPGGWDSKRGVEVRMWLLNNELVTPQYQATKKGWAWLDMILSTPLPEQQWVNPLTSEVVETK